MKDSLEAQWKMKINFRGYAMVHVISVKDGCSFEFMYFCFTALLQGSLFDCSVEGYWQEKT